MIESFNSWLLEKQPEITHVGRLLAKELSSEPAELIENMIEIEAWGSRVGELLAWLESFLIHAKRFYLPNDTEMKEMERRAIVEDSVRDIKKVRDIVEGYKDAIETRISLAQSILRFEKPHIQPVIEHSRPY